MTRELVIRIEIDKYVLPWHIVNKLEETLPPGAHVAGSDVYEEQPAVNEQQDKDKEPGKSPVNVAPLVWESLCFEHDGVYYASTAAPLLKNIKDLERDLKAEKNRTTQEWDEWTKNHIAGLHRENKHVTERLKTLEASLVKANARRTEDKLRRVDAEAEVDALKRSYVLNASLVKSELAKARAEERKACAKVAADWLTHWVNDCLTELPEDAAKSAWTLPDSIRHRDAQTHADDMAPADAKRDVVERLSKYNEELLLQLKVERKAVKTALADSTYVARCEAVDEARSEEREACAVTAEEWWHRWASRSVPLARTVGDAIRNQKT